MTSDVALMEASLVAAAEAWIEIRHRLFERFFEAYPARRATFYNLEASGPRMTDETLQMMFGLAGDEKWVQPLISELTFTHRSYGALPMEEYRVFIDMTVEELGKAAGDAWTSDCADAWNRQATRLKTMIERTRQGWARAMPGQVSAR